MCVSVCVYVFVCVWCLCVCARVQYQLFPQCKNGFRVGMRLEGIDHEHPSMYCVLTIAEVTTKTLMLSKYDILLLCYFTWSILWLTCAYLQVVGHRIRLHFDKYSDCYDFWVNSNSPDIHPVGWCEKTGHKLHPPKGKKHQPFTKHPEFNSRRQNLVVVVKLYLVFSL